MPGNVPERSIPVVFVKATRLQVIRLANDRFRNIQSTGQKNSPDLEQAKLKKEGFWGGFPEISNCWSLGLASYAHAAAHNCLRGLSSMKSIMAST